jgi:hypothetical protein
MSMLQDTTTFCYTRLGCAHNNWAPLVEALRAQAWPALAAAQISCWGLWSGLFGLAANEVVLITVSDRRNHVPGLRNALAAVACDIHEMHELAATLRPESRAPLAVPGLYVFRFFDVRNHDIDEIVALSGQAWTTFETAEAYQSQPQGLFCPADRSAERGLMLLCTWYDDFASWEASRAPPDEARENFRRRHALTANTWAIAARLVPPLP